MYARFNKNTLIKIPFSSQFFRRNFSSPSNPNLVVKITPDISYVGAKVLVPISLARYDQGEKEKNKYDRDIHLIFSALSKKMEKGEVADVDVLLTGGLQHINWPKEKCNKIEGHFLSIHEKSLNKLSNFFYWDQFIDDVIGRNKFTKVLSEVNSKSVEGSKWYELMSKTHEEISVSGSLFDSIKYQRTKYALIASATGLYTHIPYFGKLSDAWSYLTVAFPNLKIPEFNKILLIKGLDIIETADVNQTVLLISSMIEQTISSPNFPEKEKIKLFELMEKLMRAYVPEEMVKRENNKDELAPSGLKMD